MQCIYFDPPYGIKFNSNWQVSTLSRDVKDGKAADITREPEQVKAFRDTWKDGIHSYLTYLRDRLTVARELLTESGSIFVQIGDENVHRVRAVMDEVFGEENFVAQLSFVKDSRSRQRDYLPSVADYILWYARRRQQLKYRQPYSCKESRRSRSDRTICRNDEAGRANAAHEPSKAAVGKLPTDGVYELIRSDRIDSPANHLAAFAFQSMDELSARQRTIGRHSETGMDRLEQGRPA